MTQSIQEVPDYEGPIKYLNQRDAPLEIPIECVKILFAALDLDLDDRVSIEEIANFVKLHQIPFTDQNIVDMFKEATWGRRIIHDRQKELPLAVEEISAAVRGRHRWNTQVKNWEVYYRPFRDFWIIMLLTVNERIFVMPMPKIIPTKILAQFEQEDIKMSTIVTKKEGMETKYLSIRDKTQIPYQKDYDKKEAGVQPEPEGLVQMTGKKQKDREHNPYDHTINARIYAAPLDSTMDKNDYAKVTFDCKEFYNQAAYLCQQIPYWKAHKENPIYQFIPTTEQPFKTM